MIDEAELKIIEDTDHSPHLRKPDELSKTIEDFIKKQV
jgi:pimeloyl-ACP methyl ester carboxylesterase